MVEKEFEFRTQFRLNKKIQIKRENHNEMQKKF